MDFPTLKVFLDIGDETAPQLVAAAVQLVSPGLTPEQFAGFLAMNMEETRQLAEACRELDFLFAEPDRGRSEASPALH